MTKTSALEALSRLGPISKLFWKIDNLARSERFALYVRDDQIIAFLYSLSNGVPTGVVSVERVTATDVITADAQTNGGDIEDALQRLGAANDRTYKVIKTFHFGIVIHLLLEQTTDRPDAIVVGEVSEDGRGKSVVLKARVEPRQLVKPMQIAS
ncbi:hypothetical protein [Rhizobium sp. MHM7A]|uniref:hypothetical protein n=1 Tax=Rhizobium sp. MHM7A TaxID=2583233 RepID=UPI0011064361|nr:hypothetical protein [Rhizobium sp. MHM7A]TLX16127.1 hypothetical protein FFR93_02040 [Rhizobium sp. MHM7A]